MVLCRFLEKKPGEGNRFHENGKYDGQYPASRTAQVAVRKTNNPSMISWPSVLLGWVIDTSVRHIKNDANRISVPAPILETSGTLDSADWFSGCTRVLPDGEADIVLSESITGGTAPLTGVLPA